MGEHDREVVLQLEWLNADFSASERADLLHAWESTESVLEREDAGEALNSKQRINTSGSNSVAHVVSAAKKLGVIFDPPEHETVEGLFGGFFNRTEPLDPEGEWIAMLEAHGIHDLNIERGDLKQGRSIETITDWDLTDFVYVMSIVTPGRRTRKALHDLFDVFDKDMSGKISLLDLKQEMEKLHPSHHKQLEDDPSTKDSQHLYKIKKVLDKENDINLVEVDERRVRPRHCATFRLISMLQRHARTQLYLPASPCELTLPCVFSCFGSFREMLMQTVMVESIKMRCAPSTWIANSL